MKVKIQRYHDWWFDNAIEFLGHLIEELDVKVEWGAYVLQFVNPEKLKRIMLFITLFAGALAIWKFLPVG